MFITQMVAFSLLRVFTRGRWVVKKGENSVYVIIEWPLSKGNVAISGLWLCLQKKTVKKYDSTRVV